MELLTVLIILCGLFVGWSVGANNTGNCFGTSVGAGLLSYRKAAWLVAIFVLIGASLQGGYTIKTIGKGIVDAALLTDISVVAILFTVALLVAASSFFGLPISTTQSVIGSILGISIFVKMGIDWPLVVRIFALGFATMGIALVISYTIYRIYSSFSAKGTFVSVEKALGWAVILSGSFLAYSLGANDIGNSMGLIVGKGLMTAFAAGFVGGFATGIGSLTFGKRVMRTIGRKITPLNAPMAFAAQFGAGIAVYLLTLLSIPTSITFAIVGSVAGVGLVKGAKAVEKQTLKKILFGWFMTPMIGAILAPLILYILKAVI